MRNLRSTFCAICVLSTVVMAQNATESTPDKSVKILKNSRDALKKLLTAMYNANYSETDAAKGAVQEMEGRGIVGRQAAPGRDKFRMELTLYLADSNESPLYTIGSDGTTFFAVDRRIRVVYEGDDKKVLGTHGDHMQNFIMRIYADPDPFARELEAETTYLGDEMVGDENCSKIWVKEAGKPEVIWFIAKSDLFPRKRVVLETASEGTINRKTLTISYFVPNPRWSATDMFEAPSDPAYVKLPVSAP